MKLTVKTLKGTHFQIWAHPSDTIMAVKKNIEEVQGKDSYPWGQQLLIHNGKVLKDESTLDENKISEDGFLVVMLSKNKSSSAGGPSTQPSTTAVARQPAAADPPAQAPASANDVAGSERPNPDVAADVYGQAASSLVPGSNIEHTVSHLMEMGGGTWDRETVLRALHAAYNNPERAVDYLYNGIPVTADVAVPAVSYSSSEASDQGINTNETAATREAPLSGVPNSSPFNMFAQGNPSLGVAAGSRSFDFLRNNPQFMALRAMVQANPQILQPMLQELSKKNPQLLRLIQEHHTEFLDLINEPIEGVEGDEPDQDEMPHAISVSPEEQEAIGRLEAMGFDRAHVIEAFLACDRNEQLAANYLLEHAGDED